MSLYVAWSNNCRGFADEQLYIMHAYIEGDRKTLCGVNIQEVGEPATPNDISCDRCRKSRRLPASTPEARP